MRSVQKKSRASSGKRGAYRKYTAEQRDVAASDVKVLGLLMAAAKHGMPIGTLGNWVRERRTAGVEVVKAVAKPAGWKRRTARRHTPSQRAQIIEERLRRQSAALQTQKARLNPEVHRALTAAFSRLAFADPDGQFLRAIARYPLQPARGRLPS